MICWTRWVGKRGFAPIGDSLTLMTRNGEYAVKHEDAHGNSYGLWTIDGEDTVDGEGWIPADEASASVIDAVVAGWDYSERAAADEICRLERIA